MEKGKGLVEEDGKAENNSMVEPFEIEMGIFELVTRTGRRRLRSVLKS
jgi:hypothetical protein